MIARLPGTLAHAALRYVGPSGRDAEWRYQRYGRGLLVPPRRTVSVGGGTAAGLCQPRSLVSASCGRGMVLLGHAGRDTATLTDGDAVLFRPGPDIAAALAAARGPGCPARLPPPGLTGVLDERRQLLAE